MDSHHQITEEIADGLAQPLKSTAAQDLSEQQWRPGAEAKAASGKLANRYELEYKLKNEPIQEKKGWFSTPCNTSAQSPELSGNKPVDTCGLELDNLYSKTKDSVVQIYVGYSSGTGFLTCDEEVCAIATNKHVVKDRNIVEIDFRNEHHSWSVYAKVLRRDAKEDLAIVEFDPKRMPGLKALRIDANPTSKENAFTIGHSHGLQQRVISPGRLNGLGSTYVSHRDGPNTKHNNWIDGRLVIYPGNSGGPLINKEGFVVGVVAAGSSYETWGPPSTRLKEILAEQARDGGTLATPANTEFTAHNVKKRVDPLVKMARGRNKSA